MDKQMLRCDICGGELEMQGGGKAVCTSCGMKYSTESLREKFNGLKVSITGSRDDVAQWKTLVNTYLQQHDFIAAERIVKRILEAIPSDEFANNLYLLLQEWKYLEIANGTLIRYSGRARNVILPEGIQTIGESAFKGSKIHSIILPNSLVSIENCAFEGCINLDGVVLPQNVESIGDFAFRDCSSLKSVDLSCADKITSISAGMFERTALVEIDIPSNVKAIGNNAFKGCYSLKTIRFPDGLESIHWEAFCVCHALEEVKIPSTVKEIGGGAFCGCNKLSKLDISHSLLSKLYSEYSTRDREDSYYDPLGGVPLWNEYIEQKEREKLRNRNVCQYCGGEFKGLFTKVCSRCGKTKDY